VQDKGCGWCGYYQVCSAGNSSGDYAGQCSLGWQYGSGCPGPCGTFSSNCSTCLNQNYNCGWCGPSLSCLPVFYDQSTGERYNAQCNSTAFVTFTPDISCPFCETRKNCSACSSATHQNPTQYTCGWCGDTSACIEGNTTNGYKQTCQQWIYGTICPDCPKYKSCYDCSFASGSFCGWCEDSQMCMSGSFNSHPPCKKWVFGTTSVCSNPHPWEPSQETGGPSFPLNSVDMAAMAIGFSLILAVVVVLMYLAIRYINKRSKEGAATREGSF